MYQAFYGFKERPFQLTPNPRYLYLSPKHREALATLRYGLTASLGVTVLLGEAGTGKTTMLSAALYAERRPEHRHVVLNNPTLAPAEFYEILADRLALPQGTGSKSRFLLAFEKDLAARHQAGGLTSIVIDEAQSLTHQLFEELRLLANLETATAKLVNLVLVGQPELADRLNDPSLRQLKQRVVLRCSLEPLELRSTASYIAARLQVAGGSPRDVFTKDAIVAIFEASRGIPRTIGVICENALLAGFAAQKKPIDAPIVRDVCRDLDLSGAPGTEQAGSPRHARLNPAASWTQARPNEGVKGTRRWLVPAPADPKADPAADDENDQPPTNEGRRMFRFF